MSPTEPTSRFTAALAQIDAMHAEDPALDCGRPEELLYAERMTARLESYVKEAPETLRLAARAQHLRRWELKRSDYPKGRAGYFKWRERQKRDHADHVGTILEATGYNEEETERVQKLVLKRDRSEAGQTLQDVVCLVFLEHYWNNFAAKHDDNKLVGIVEKTLRKMSERAIGVALTFDFDERSTMIIKKASGSWGQDEEG